MSCGDGWRSHFVPYRRGAKPQVQSNMRSHGGAPSRAIPTTACWRSITSVTERSLQAVALRRKNFLFVGSDCGGERAAAMYSLIGSARLSGLDPELYLRTGADADRRSPIRGSAYAYVALTPRPDEGTYYLQPILGVPPTLCGCLGNRGLDHLPGNWRRKPGGRFETDS
jgi:hypothetical protein